MISKMRLKNFKIWEDTGEIKISPVTLLLGTNSSGKSSILQSLLLLKQTVRSTDRMIHLNMGGDDSHDIFNFGTFKDIHYKYASERQFELYFDFSANTREIHDVKFHSIYRQDSKGGVVQDELELRTGSEKFRFIRRERDAYSFLLNDATQPIDKGRYWAPERSTGFSAEALSHAGEYSSKLQDISLVIQKEMAALVYLGPLRRKPERDYQWNKTTPGEMGFDGQKAVDILLASTFAKNNGNSIDILESVSKWLKLMGVAERIRLKQVGRSTRYEVVIIQDELEINLRDVGIGVSQVLPVLILAYFVPEGSTILLEEPEIHLHPLAQSVLAELFVEVSQQRNIQFLVETHSEHLFRRMQTLIARQSLSLDRCSLFFVERNMKNATLRKLDVDEYGRLTNWPESFFGDALGETREQARLMFSRKQGIDA